jgi:hypothetical protein
MSETTATFWSAKQILTTLADADLRRAIVTKFWKQGESHARAVALVHMAKTMHFREETLRKAPAEKKADWLLSRISAPEMGEAFEMALMLHHTAEKSELMGAFLDRWNIPHDKGTIESDDYKAPTREQVESAVAELEPKYGARDIAIYLATAGLLMGAGESEWRDAMWPVVDSLAAKLS